MNSKIFNENLMKNGRGLNPALLQTMCGNPSKMVPGKTLKDASSELICSCGATRTAAINCLKRIEGDTSKLAEDKRKCAREILSDPSLCFHR
jgi:hypothetical protein